MKYWKTTGTFSNSSINDYIQTQNIRVHKWTEFVSHIQYIVQITVAIVAKQNRLIYKYASSKGAINAKTIYSKQLFTMNLGNSVSTSISIVTGNYDRCNRHSPRYSPKGWVQNWFNVWGPLSFIREVVSQTVDNSQSDTSCQSPSSKINILEKGQISEFHIQGPFLD